MSSQQPHQKVLFLPRWYPNLYDPMPGLFIRRHALSVASYYQVMVLYVHLDFNLKGKSYEWIRSGEHGIPELTIYYKACRSSIKWFASLVNLFRFFLAHFRGFRMLKQEFGEVDLIHVNVLTRLGFIARIYKVFTGTPYVITEHWTRYLPGMDNFNGWLRKTITRRVVKHASAVLPVTLNLQRAMEKHGLRNPNYYVIPNVVDTSLFIPDFASTVSSRKMFIHVSCFDDRQKNISGMLRVLRILADKRQDWKCIMVGEGIHFEMLVQLGDELGLKDTFVEFVGLKENKELAVLMQQACFQVMFSRYENLPVVIPESFACGVPFISTNVGGIAEHIHKELGLLIPSEDEPALLDSLEYMLDHTGEFDKRTIRRYAEEHFSKEVIGKQISDVYSEVLNRSQRR